MSSPATSNLLQDKIALLPKHAKGLAVVHLIKEVLEHPLIFVYGELKDAPQVSALKDNPETEPWVRLVDIFAFGVYKDYKREQSSLPPLTPGMENKLRALTIISLAERGNKRLLYSSLLEELELPSLRSLEDLLIEVIYSKGIEGKMDQKNAWLEVSSTIGRDIRKEQLDGIASILSSWCDNCDNVLANIESQIILANQLKGESQREKVELENQISKMKASCKGAAAASLLVDYEDDVIHPGTPSSQGSSQGGGASFMERTRRKFSRSKAGPFHKGGYK